MNEKNYDDALFNEMGAKSIEEVDNIQQQDTKPLGNVYPQEITKKTVVKDGDLGRATMMDMNRLAKEEMENDPEIQKMNALLDYQRIYMENSPSGGAFYDDDFQLYIRAARVAEIRSYSMVDENNYNDLYDKMNTILSRCCKVMYGTSYGSWKDIKEIDKFFVLMQIRDLTFKEGETALNIPVPQNACKTSDCHPQRSVQLKSEMIEPAKWDSKIEKFYNYEEKCFVLDNKKGTIIKLAPPSIGVYNFIREWVIECQNNNRPWDDALTTIASYLMLDWRATNDRSLRDMMAEITGWDTNRYLSVYDKVERIVKTVGMKPNIIVQCESCGGDMEVPLTFQPVEDEQGHEYGGGLKQLFVPAVSDRFDEFL